MAPPAGIEPATYGLEVRRSIQLSYGSLRSFVAEPREIDDRKDHETSEERASAHLGPSGNLSFSARISIDCSIGLL